MRSVPNNNRHTKKPSESSLVDENRPETESAHDDLFGKVSNAVWYGVGMAVLAIAIIVPTLLLHDQLPQEVQKWILPSMIPMGIFVVVVVLVVGFQMIRRAVRWFRRH